MLRPVLRIVVTISVFKFLAHQRTDFAKPPSVLSEEWTIVEIKKIIE